MGDSKRVETVGRRVPGWHNFEPDLVMMRAQLKQIIHQAQSLSKAISEVLCIEEETKKEV